MCFIVVFIQCILANAEPVTVTVLHWDLVCAGSGFWGYVQAFREHPGNSPSFCDCSDLGARHERS